ncbi:MAG: hypothetical protein JWR21_2593 [Herminiimonas sp.]|nr:hypothetical protein [Herminiimonas sp.]
MRRIESLHVPSETRRMLRERLLRFLPTNLSSRGYLDRTVRPSVSDKEVVELYLNLVLAPGDDISRARDLYKQASEAEMMSGTLPPPQTGDVPSIAPALSATGTSCEMPSAPLPVESTVAALGAHEKYEPTTVKGDSIEELDSGSLPAPLCFSMQIISASASLEGLSPAPSFDELVQRGWIRTSWGRFSVPHDIVMAILRHPEASGTAFKLLIEERGRDAFRLKSGFNPSGELQDIANGVVTEQYRPGEIACISRPWIAARLWDTSLDGTGDGSVQDLELRISHWIDRWQLLNSPSFAISDQLEPASFGEFVEAAMSVLREPTTTPGWEEFREAAGAPTALLYPSRGAAPESIVSAIPATTAGRIRWMTNGIPERTFHEYLDSRGSSLLRVLLNEIQDATWDPQRLAPRLMEFVVERPVLLQQLVLTVRQAPVLLADMLMTSSTCPLACSLIASWEFSDGGWNRDFQAAANHTTELLAFEDAIALLGGHVDAGLVPVSELAALYLHIYELASAPRQPARRYAVLSMLRLELTSISSSVQDSVVAALIALAAADAVPMTAFCAALDLASEGGCVDRIDPSEMVSLYLDILLPRGERLGPRQLEMKSAQSFVALVQRCDVNLRSRFLNAVDVRAWLRSAPTSPDEQYAFRDLLARRIRLHVRLLSRAVAGWPTEVPIELVDALSNTIHAGATDHQDRGRVDAFAAWADVRTPVGPAGATNCSRFGYRASKAAGACHAKNRDPALPSRGAHRSRGHRCQHPVGPQ